MIYANNLFATLRLMYSKKGQYEAVNFNVVVYDG
jgi:hypothetical protein